MPARRRSLDKLAHFCRTTRSTLTDTSGSLWVFRPSDSLKQWNRLSSQDQYLMLIGDLAKSRGSFRSEAPRIVGVPDICEAAKTVGLSYSNPVIQRVVKKLLLKGKVLGVIGRYNAVYVIPFFRLEGVDDGVDQLTTRYYRIRDLRYAINSCHIPGGWHSSSRHVALEVKQSHLRSRFLNDDLLDETPDLSILDTERLMDPYEAKAAAEGLTPGSARAVREDSLPPVVVEEIRAEEISNRGEMIYRGSTRSSPNLIDGTRSLSSPEMEIIIDTMTPEMLHSLLCSNRKILSDQVKSLTSLPLEASFFLHQTGEDSDA